MLVLFTPYSKCFAYVLFTSYLCFARFNLINQSVFFIDFFFSHVWSPYFLYLFLLFSCSRADSSSKKTKSSSEESRSETYGKLKQPLQALHLCSLLHAFCLCTRGFYPLRDPHGWLCSKEWETGFTCCFSVSACSSRSGWKLTRTWQAQAGTYVLLFSVPNWENLVGLLFLEILCHRVFLALCEDTARAGLQQRFCSWRKVWVLL